MDYKLGDTVVYLDKPCMYIGPGPVPKTMYHLVQKSAGGWSASSVSTAELGKILLNRLRVCGITDNLWWVRLHNIKALPEGSPL